MHSAMCTRGGILNSRLDPGRYLTALTDTGGIGRDDVTSRLNVEERLIRSSLVEIKITNGR
jgi:hypothetical protein